MNNLSKAQDAADSWAGALFNAGAHAVSVEYNAVTDSYGVFAWFEPGSAPDDEPPIPTRSLYPDVPLRIVEEPKFVPEEDCGY